MSDRELGKYQPRTPAEESGAEREMKRVLTKSKNWPYSPSLGNAAIILSRESNEDGASAAIVALEQSWEASYGEI